MARRYRIKNTDIEGTIGYDGSGTATVIELTTDAGTVYRVPSDFVELVLPEQPGHGAVVRIGNAIWRRTALGGRWHQLRRADTRISAREDKSWEQLIAWAIERGQSVEVASFDTLIEKAPETPEAIAGSLAKETVNVNPWYPRGFGGAGGSGVAVSQTINGVTRADVQAAYSRVARRSF